MEGSPVIDSNPAQSGGDVVLLRDIFLEGVDRLKETYGPDFPITAWTTACLMDAQGECTLESIAQATGVLEQLVANGTLAEIDSLEVGGDHIPIYGSPAAINPPSQKLNSLYY